MRDADFEKREKAALDELFTPEQQRVWLSMASPTERFSLVANWESMPFCGIEPFMKVLGAMKRVKSSPFEGDKSNLPADEG